MKNFKRFICGFLVLVLCFVFINNEVSAATSCTKYEDYYFFVLIETEDYWNDHKNTAWQIKNGTDFESLPKTRQNFKTGVYCLQKSENDCNNFDGKKMGLDEFYRKYIAALQGTEKTITLGGKTATSTLHYIQENNNGVVKKYVTHGRWDKLADNSNDIQSFTTYVDVSDVNYDELVTGSFLPNTSISMDYSTSDGYRYQNIRAEITRNVDVNDWTTVANGVNAFEVVWGSNSIKKSILAPALAYDEYEVCEESADPSLYTAKIYYLYKDTNKTAATTFSRQYADGDGERISSPIISGCTPDLANVDVRINGGNFEKTVYYTCAVADNPKTGNILFIVCMIVGFSSLAYFLYWVFVGRKKTSEEV